MISIFLRQHKTCNKDFKMRSRMHKFLQFALSRIGIFFFIIIIIIMQHMFHLRQDPEGMNDDTRINDRHMRNNTRICSIVHGSYRKIRFVAEDIESEFMYHGFLNGKLKDRFRNFRFFLYCLYWGGGCRGRGTMGGVKFRFSV